MHGRLNVATYQPICNTNLFCYVAASPDKGDAGYAQTNKAGLSVRLSNCRAHVAVIISRARRLKLPTANGGRKELLQKDKNERDAKH